MEKKLKLELTRSNKNQGDLNVNSGTSHFLTSFDTTVSGLLSEHFNHDPFLDSKSPKFENFSHD